VHPAQLLTQRSLGASGIIFGLFAIFACIAPSAQMSLIFLPGLSFSAYNGVIAMAVIDALGTLAMLAGRSTGLGHAAHLGGVLGGFILYDYVLKKYNRNVRELRKTRRFY
jgi:membrane associated rhomboid family serine protease